MQFMKQWYCFLYLTNGFLFWLDPFVSFTFSALLRYNGLQGDQTSLSRRKSFLNVHWKDWCWTWNSNTLATWCEELTHLKRPWCRERLKARGEGDNKGWDGWMASLTQWRWVWVNSRSWWWTGRPGLLQSTVLQRVRHDWATELNWILSTEFKLSCLLCNHQFWA